MDLHTSCVTHASMRVSRAGGPNGKLFRIKVVAIASLLAVLGTAAHATSADTSDPLNSFAGTTDDAASDSSVANMNTDADAPIPLRRYSNNAKTNETVNAVFQLIQTQGNGLVWDGSAEASEKAASAADPTAVSPTQVAAPPLPSNPDAKLTVAKLIQHQGAIPFAQSALASTPAPAASASVTASSANAIVAAALAQPVTPPLPTWTVKPNATLQQTLTDWSRTEGWADPKWLSQNPYQIEAAPIHGSFMDALQAIANSAPQLDIHVSMEKRELTVTDAQSK